MKKIKNTEEVEKFIEVMSLEYRASRIIEIVGFLNNLKHIDNLDFSFERVLLGNIEQEFYKKSQKNKIVKILSDNGMECHMSDVRTIVFMKIVKGLRFEKVIDCFLDLEKMEMLGDKFFIEEIKNILEEE